MEKNVGQVLEGSSSCELGLRRSRVNERMCELLAGREGGKESIRYWRGEWGNWRDWSDTKGSEGKGQTSSKVDTELRILSKDLWARLISPIARLGRGAAHPRSLRRLE
jgi:hypothetical protein